MTKTFNLELHGGYYCMKLQREAKGKVTDYWRKMLCLDFVELVGGQESPVGHLVRVTLSTEQIGAKGGVAALGVQQQGYYRWWWRFMDKGIREKNHKYGMGMGCEGILMGIFPDENGDGLAGEHSLWVRVESL